MPNYKHCNNYITFDPKNSDIGKRSHSPAITIDLKASTITLPKKALEFVYVCFKISSEGDNFDIVIQKCDRSDPKAIAVPKMRKIKSKDLIAFIVEKAFGYDGRTKPSKISIKAKDAYEQSPGSICFDGLNGVDITK